ncbi:hypothetical protein V6N12_060615 [Hibiscus sabdariffa]|uniref:Globin family profile domain-containing protein n=1 Tax=Hibiscus sabdariffa TaxID=183260 RepID=A0ABR2D4Z3_9ROSI
MQEAIQSAGGNANQSAEINMRKWVSLAAFLHHVKTAIQEASSTPGPVGTAALRKLGQMHMAHAGMDYENL